MFYSAIHKAAVWPATVQNDLRRSFLLVAPIDSQWTLFCSTGIVPGKAGNGSAGSFVNRAVKNTLCQLIGTSLIKSRTFLYLNLISSIEQWTANYKFIKLMWCHKSENGTYFRNASNKCAHINAAI